MQIIVVTNCNEKWIRNGKEELERWVLVLKSFSILGPTGTMPEGLIEG